MKRWILGAFAITSLMASGVGVAEDASAPDVSTGKTMLVLDASGSMWGQLENEHKIVTARSVISDMLDDWGDQGELGLMAYGHRREGDCSDIETLVPVGAANQTIIRSAVNDLNPKGKTPITESLRQAASALGSTENPATVILVSDGLETCNADPCALAADLEASGADFTAHIIGFGLKDEEFATLQCIATETGGQFLNASTAAELSAAMTATVAEAKTAGSIGIRAVAVPCENCDPFNDVSVTFNIFAADEAGKKIGDKITTIVTQGGFRALDPGKYVVEGFIDSRMVFTTPINVEVGTDSASDVALVIPAGRVSAKTFQTADGPDIEKGLFYRFYGAENETGTRAETGLSQDMKPTKWLPAGEAFIEASLQQLKASETLLVEAGQDHDVTLNMNMGFVDISARQFDGEDLLGGPNLWVNTPQQDGSVRYNVGFSTGKKVGSFALQAGDYLATAKFGDAQRSTPITVIAGETQEYTIDLKAGSVSLMAGYEEGTPIGGVNWQILKSEGGQAAASYSSSEPTFTLVEGDYIARAIRNFQPTDLPFSVVAGEKSEVFIILPTP
ncbi:MAG: VWA domain-containing protein [Henriciella sp.]|nr:VWA domain-containing protein [Henriciella sp.]